MNQSDKIGIKHFLSQERIEDLFLGADGLIPRQWSESDVFPVSTISYSQPPPEADEPTIDDSVVLKRTLKRKKNRKKARSCPCFTQVEEGTAANSSSMIETRISLPTKLQALTPHPRAPPARQSLQPQPAGQTRTPTSAASLAHLATAALPPPIIKPKRAIRDISDVRYRRPRIFPPDRQQSPNQQYPPRVSRTADHSTLKPREPSRRFLNMGSFIMEQKSTGWSELQLNRFHASVHDTGDTLCPREKIMIKVDQRGKVRQPRISPVLPVISGQIAKVGGIPDLDLDQLPTKLAISRAREILKTASTLTRTVRMLGALPPVSFSGM
ncbi:hypothetical protein HDU93_002476 [Gonapodya sp. JEL0774]|nr:hypothetical protein HDU93_002476 [Gonapodya sp. JEL0774]